MSYLWTEGPFDIQQAVALDVPDTAWPTFHGRDVFAPAAAQLASGTRLRDLGDDIGDPMILGEAFATQLGTGLSGRVVVVDHFGNAITTIREEDCAGRRIAGVSWPGGGTTQVVATYDDIAPGTLAVLFGSAGHVEVAAHGAAAASLGGPGAHTAVTLEFVPWA